MGCDPERIALRREAFRLARWPITEVAPETATECVIDGQRRVESELAPVLGRPFAPPRGWRQRLASP